MLALAIIQPLPHLAISALSPDLSGAIRAICQYNILIAIVLIIGFKDASLDKKENIFNFILRNPGCTITDISKNQKMYRSTIKYYIDNLYKKGKIDVVKFGKISRFFQKSPHLDHKEKIIISYFNNDVSKKILNEIFNNEGLTNQEISRKTSIDRSYTYHYLQKFINNNIIYKNSDNKRYYIYTDVRNLIDYLLRKLSHH